VDDARRKDMAVLLSCVAFVLAANVILFAIGTLPVRQNGIPDWWNTSIIIVGVVMTLAMFSFLYRDNPLFRAGENLFVGLGLGVSLTVEWYNFLKPHVYDILVAPLFDPTVDVQRGEFIRLIPLFLGLLIVFRISKKYGWVSRYPLAMLIGFWSGFAIQPSIHSNILKHVGATILPTPLGWLGWLCVAAAAALFCATAYYAPKGGKLALWLKVASGVVVLAYIALRTTPALQALGPWAQAFQSIDKLIILVGVLAVLVYFFFSLEHKGPVGVVSRLGIIFLMVSFGASFGYTVMARESLVLGRIQFLLGDWLGVL